MSKFFARFVFVFVLMSLFSATITPLFNTVYADGGTIKRACTVNDTWWTKMWDPCTDVAPQPSTPGVYDQPIFDRAKWEQAMKDAEQWLREHNTGNNYPVENSELTKQAWKLYCGVSTGEPQYSVTGEPVCPVQ